MPSKSKKQAKLMRAVAHGWKPDRFEGPTRAVAQEFVTADKRRSKVDGYQFGGRSMAGRYGMMPQVGGGRDPRGMPPQGGPQGGALAQIFRQRQMQQKPRPGGRDMRGFPGRGGPAGMRNPRQPIMRGRPGRGGKVPGRGPFGGRDPRAMPPQQGGPLRQIFNQQRSQQDRGLRGMFPDKGPRQQVPPSPPRGYPGGGNPNLGGRNPMMRGANRMRGRYMR